MDKIFNPLSVAVIGASNNSNKSGYKILKNIKDASFKGKVYGVNINDNDFYKSILDIEEDIDLVIIVIPKKEVINIVKECVKKKVKSIIIISGGFKESGDIESENSIKKLIEGTGIRVVGPNSCGVISGNINASFSKNERIKNGDLFLITQSGAILTSLVDFAAESNLGISKAISLGNKMNISEADLIEYVLENEFLCFYLESIENFEVFTRKFSEIKNPLFILSPGKSNKSQSEIKSHTGAIVSDKDIISLALLKNNFIELASLEDLFDVSKIFSNSKYKNILDTKLCIVTNAGGMAILSTDSMENTDLTFASLSQVTLGKLNKYFLGRILSNPIDILGDADSQRYKDILDIINDDVGIDIILLLVTPQSNTDTNNIVKVINDFSQKSDKFVVTVFTGGHYANEAINFLTEQKIPSFNFPERAIKSLNFLSKYIDNKNRRKDRSDIVLNNDEEISSIIKKSKGEILGFSDARNILKKFNIKFPESLVIKNIEDLKVAISKIGYPVTLKIDNVNIAHKTDVSGVINNILNYEDLLNAFERLHSLSKEVLIQEYIETNFEIMVGAIKYKGIGSVITIGAGGIFTQILDDHVKEFLPIDRSSAFRLLQKTKFYPLLSGYRGLVKYDEGDIINILMGISYLIDNIEGILGIDINPIILSKDKGILVIDPKIYLCA